MDHKQRCEEEEQLREKQEKNDRKGNKDVLLISAQLECSYHDALMMYHEKNENLVDTIMHFQFTEYPRVYNFAKIKRNT